MRKKTTIEVKIAPKLLNLFETHEVYHVTSVMKKAMEKGIFPRWKVRALWLQSNLNESEIELLTKGKIVPFKVKRARSGFSDVEITPIKKTL